MAHTNNKTYYNPIYEGSIQGSQQPEEQLYDSTQQIIPAEYEVVHISSSSSPYEPKSKETVSSNVLHHSNGVGNCSNQKERIKWLIILIILITSILLNVIVVITLYTKEISCPQVINTTQMAHQAGYVSRGYGNTTDEMILQKIDNSITTLIDMVGAGDIQQLVKNNITTLIEMFVDNTQLIKNVTVSLQQLITTQSILANISIENKGTINNILVKVDNVLENQIASVNTSRLISSCQDIKNVYPGSPSGYYHINGQLVYCEMGELCSSEGGWTRLAYLDMTDSTVACPPGFKIYEVNGVRACGRPDAYGSCVSIEFPSNGISYSEVCGRVVGYQLGSTDALHTSSTNIDSPYVDGVSITQGYPRKHVWTLIAGQSSTTSTTNDCRCNILPGSTWDINMFIGNDFFCESGNPTSSVSFILYSDDPLWNGKECGSEEQDCCLANGLPWFHNILTSTTDYLELRVCSDESSDIEDTPISLYELYIK